jgi:hypothetical protein
MTLHKSCPICRHAMELMRHDWRCCNWDCGYREPIAMPATIIQAKRHSVTTIREIQPC